MGSNQISNPTTQTKTIIDFHFHFRFHLIITLQLHVQIQQFNNVKLSTTYEYVNDAIKLPIDYKSINLLQL